MIALQVGGVRGGVEAVTDDCRAASPLREVPTRFIRKGWWAFVIGPDGGTRREGVGGLRALQCCATGYAPAWSGLM
jgi:hypothetical protein